MFQNSDKPTCSAQDMTRSELKGGCCPRDVTPAARSVTWPRPCRDKRRPLDVQFGGAPPNCEADLTFFLEPGLQSESFSSYFRWQTQCQSVIGRVTTICGASLPHMCPNARRQRSFAPFRSASALKSLCMEDLMQADSRVLMSVRRKSGTLPGRSTPWTVAYPWKKFRIRQLSSYVSSPGG